MESLVSLQILGMPKFRKAYALIDSVVQGRFTGRRGEAQIVPFKARNT
jgi:hypothetical protein